MASTMERDRGTQAHRVPRHQGACSVERNRRESGMPKGWCHEALRGRLRAVREVLQGLSREGKRAWT